MFFKWKLCNLIILALLKLKKSYYYPCQEAHNKTKDSALVTFRIVTLCCLVQ